MTLRSKLVLALASIAAVATVIVGLMSYRATRDELQQSVDASLRSAARILAPVAENLPGRPGRAVEGIVVQRIDDSGAISRDPDEPELPVSEVDLALAGDSARPGVGVFRSIEVGGEPYRMLTVATRGGAVQLARSTADLEAALDSIRNRTILLVGVVVAGSALLGSILARQLTRRLTRLQAAAGEVAATGRLDVPMPVDGHDETAAVARSMQTMLAALATSRAQQQQLIQDSGHELRTPLTSMRTNLQVLARFDQLDDASRRAIIADLDSEARELSTLVEEVLALATDRYVDEPIASVSIGTLAERVAARARRRSGREIVVRHDGAVAAVRPAAIERAISNLIDNAIKFSPDGPIDVTIARGDTDVDISVRDHGAGIDPAEAPRLFDRFHRSVAARGTPGSGLGLSIVAATAEAHGGSVHAANAVGGGAVVGFRVPVDTVDTGAIEA